MAVQPPTVGVQHQLTITLFRNGQINVTGPMGNKLLCYGMLEAARDVIASFKAPSVVVPDFVPPSIDKMRGGDGAEG